VERGGSQCKNRKTVNFGQGLDSERKKSGRGAEQGKKGGIKPPRRKRVEELSFHESEGCRIVVNQKMQETAGKGFGTTKEGHAEKIRRGYTCQTNRATHVLGGNLKRGKRPNHENRLGKNSPEPSAVETRRRSHHRTDATRKVDD